MTRRLPTSLLLTSLLVAAAAVYLAISVANLVSGAVAVRAATAPPDSYGTINMGHGDEIYHWDLQSRSMQ